MAKRCLRCWNRVSTDPVIIADDFEGCFCKNCYDESAERSLDLIWSFLETEDRGLADELFSQIEESTIDLDLSEDGQDLLFGFLSQKMSEKDQSESIDIVHLNERIARDQELPESEIRKVHVKKKFLAVTSNSIEGYRIKSYHGVVTGAAVMGMGVFSHINDWGGENRRVSNKIEEVKDQAMEYAIDHAVSAGGNALISVEIDFDTIEAVAIAVVVSGTSVTVEKIEPEC